MLSLTLLLWCLTTILGCLLPCSSYFLFSPLVGVDSQAIVSSTRCSRDVDTCCTVSWHKPCLSLLYDLDGYHRIIGMLVLCWLFIVLVLPTIPPSPPCSLLAVKVIISISEHVEKLFLTFEKHPGFKNSLNRCNFSQQKQSSNHECVRF